ncbi:MAG: hypothetical protein HRU25_18335, partial [Psychrobium sp.]|nr:hypothetical protein [Psychrobium sp.]
WRGQLLLVDNKQPQYGCYECLFEPEQDALSSASSMNNESCATLGVSGPMVGVVASYQANAAIRHLLSLPQTLSAHICLLDSNMNMQSLTRKRRLDCRVCRSEYSEQ